MSTTTGVPVYIGEESRALIHANHNWPQTHVAYPVAVAEARERVIAAARDYASTGRGRSERLRTVLLRCVAALDALEGNAS